jgi:hypothetical protein
MQLVFSYYQILPLARLNKACFAVNGRLPSGQTLLLRRVSLEENFGNED